jgi:hypothetical protein
MREEEACIDSLAHTFSLSLSVSHTHTHSSTPHMFHIFIDVDVVECRKENSVKKRWVCGLNITNEQTLTSIY